MIIVFENFVDNVKLKEFILSFTVVVIEVAWNCCLWIEKIVHLPAVHFLSLKMEPDLLELLGS